MIEWCSSYKLINLGNESLVDNVLAISLQYGGRLVSMGYYVNKKAVSYYAIMHQYDGKYQARIEFILVKNSV